MKHIRNISVLFIVFMAIIPIININAQKNDEQNDSFMGDWKTAEGDYFAQVYVNSEGIYMANILTKLYSSGDPVAILSGEKVNDKKLILNGDGWYGKIEKKKLKIQKGKEKLEFRVYSYNSPTLNAPAPENAIILFDGSNLDAWGKMAPKQWVSAVEPADNWKILPGIGLEVVPGTGSIATKKEFSDFKLHLEFRVLGGEINGGVYLQSRYEINIKDSYGQIEGSPCGALGNVIEPVHPTPEHNLAVPPMRWHTFDIDFRAPRFDESGENKTENARVTLYYNGELIYDDIELAKLKGAAARLGEAPLGPIYLQEHGTAYQFRNIWIIDKSDK